MADRTKEVALQHEHRARVARTEPPPTGIEAQLALLTNAVRQMADVLAEHTKELRKLNELAAETDGDGQLIEVLKRIQETLEGQTAILNTLATRSGAKPGAARTN